MLKLCGIFYSRTIEQYKAFNSVERIVYGDVIEFGFSNTNNPLILNQRADTILGVLNFLDNSYSFFGPYEVAFVIDDVTIKMKLRLNVIPKIISFFGLTDITIEGIKLSAEDCLQLINSFESFIAKLKIIERRLAELVPEENAEEDTDEN